MNDFRQLFVDFDINVLDTCTAPLWHTYRYVYIEKNMHDYNNNN